VFLFFIFWGQKRKYGEVLNSALRWGRVPRLLATVTLLYGALDNSRSSLSPVLRSLVTVRVSQINLCLYCVDINSYILANRCGSIEKINELANWRESALFGDAERLALDYAETMTYTDRQVTDEQFNALKTCFNDESIIELAGLIAFQNMSCKFNSALDIPPQDFCFSNINN
jgi:uncharacterized peroxidase-related enzyme